MRSAARIPGEPADPFFTSGTRLGKYELLRRLAVGGMAELYLARASGIEGFEKLVVLKHVLPQYASDEETIRMFLDEARLAATLDHPNIAPVHDIGREGGNYFFTMEYVRGADLVRILDAARAANRPLPLGLAIAIVEGVAAGLHHAHEQSGPAGRPLGIVHRDVSPSNILVSFEGVVKLVDFGIAKAAVSRRAATRAGEIRGKTSYMSPEQSRGQPLDRRSDIFAVGILLWELTTGRRLFGEGTDYEILHRVVTEDAPAPSAQVAGYPAGLEAIVLKALRRSREERYATAQELQLALEHLARHLGITTSAFDLAAYMESLFGKQRPIGPDGLPFEEVPGRISTGTLVKAQASETMGTARAAPVASTPRRALVAGVLLLGAIAAAVLATRFRALPAGVVGNGRESVPSPGPEAPHAAPPARKPAPMAGASPSPEPAARPPRTAKGPRPGARGPKSQIRPLPSAPPSAVLDLDAPLRRK